MMLRRLLGVGGAGLVLTLGLSACGPVENEVPELSQSSSSSIATSESTTPDASPAPEQEAEADPGETDSGEEATPEAGTAAAALENLAVKGRAPKTGYERELFGPAWADVDHNGCDTRNDILARDLENETFRPGTQDCVVLTGLLADPFTATEIHFQRGQDTSTAVQIDHVVALSDAWQKGAQQLDEEQRRQFANDPLNLLAVDGPSNSQKGDGDAATWLPPNRAFRCDYVSRQIAVKARYQLWITAAEKDAMSTVLGNCPAHPLPDDVNANTAYQVTTTGTQFPATEVAPEEQPIEVPAAPANDAEVLPAAVPETADTATDPRFSSCAKAKAAGHGPYVSGVDVEYNWYRDGDNDGINCE
ncbi:Excalibur calcium-binding domain protein [Corynebacterium occultum]|uniref:Excalibur calcium-binding domain protein n=1 Tax=Corynebacterium occultum TaxID=2675219 RepID=A0A6B8W237_9CORY|nr:DUF1524 domain-containing protein [Corynebacterium occultum]QGU06077.1 Excalibur calcium-binding domain protein [Corynebacterium occultum]